MDVQRVAELVQDPRPVEEKQQLVLQVRLYLSTAAPHISAAATVRQRQQPSVRQHAPLLCHAPAP